MDFASAIERNRAALAAIVAELIAMVGVLTVEHLPRPLYRAVLLVLRPAESAVRRLVCVLAFGLEVKEAAARAFPAGLGRGSRTARAPKFQLFDSRKRFDFNRPRRLKPGQGPRITFFLDDPADPRVPFFRPPAIKVIELNPARAPGETVAAKSLCRRLAAISAALEDLPKQAMRLARWRARRAKMKTAKFRDPLRPGPAPGLRKRASRPIDDILQNCGWLARERERADTS